MSKKILIVLMVSFGVQINAFERLGNSARSMASKVPQVIRGMQTQAPKFGRAFRFRESVDYTQYAKPNFVERVNNYFSRGWNRFKTLMYGNPNPHVILESNGTRIVPKSQIHTTQPTVQPFVITPQESSLLFPHVSKSPYTKVPSADVEKAGHGVLNAASTIEIERGVIEEILKGHGHKALPDASKNSIEERVDRKLYKGVIGRFSERDKKSGKKESKEQRKERSIQKMVDEGFFKENGIDMQDRSVRNSIENIVDQMQQKEDFYKEMTSEYDNTVSKKIERIEETQKEILKSIQSAHESAKKYPSLAKQNNAEIAVTEREGWNLWNRLEDGRQELLQQEERTGGVQDEIGRLQKQSATSFEKAQKEWCKNDAIQKMEKEGFFEKNGIDTKDKSVLNGIKSIVDQMQQKEDFYKEMTSRYDDTVSKKIERIEKTQEEILNSIQSAQESAKKYPSLAKQNNAEIAVTDREGWNLWNQLEERRQELLQQEETAGGVQDEIKRLQKQSATSFEKEQKEWRKNDAIQKMEKEGFFEKNGIDMKDKWVRSRIENIVDQIQHREDFFKEMTSQYDNTLSKKIERIEKERGKILELVQAAHESAKKYPSLVKQNDAEIAVAEREALKWYDYLTQEAQRLITEREMLERR